MHLFHIHLQKKLLIWHHFCNNRYKTLVNVVLLMNLKLKRGHLNVKTLLSDHQWHSAQTATRKVKQIRSQSQTCDLTIRLTALVWPLFTVQPAAMETHRDPVCLGCRSERCQTSSCMRSESLCRSPVIMRRLISLTFLPCHCSTHLAYHKF